LQLQLLEAEHLPFDKNEADGNGNQIRCGIEFDKIGRRVAYHFYRKHPGDNTDQSGKGEIVRVPASEILHLYRPQRPGQIRGVPWISPALVKLISARSIRRCGTGSQKSSRVVRWLHHQERAGR
jgi:capsid protein